MRNDGKTKQLHAMPSINVKLNNFHDITDCRMKLQEIAATLNF